MGRCAPRGLGGLSSRSPHAWGFVVLPRARPGPGLPGHFDVIIVFLFLKQNNIYFFVFILKGYLLCKVEGFVSAPRILPRQESVQGSRERPSCHGHLGCPDGSPFGLPLALLFRVAVPGQCRLGHTPTCPRPLHPSGGRGVHGPDPAPRASEAMSTAGPDSSSQGPARPRISSGSSK